MAKTFEKRETLSLLSRKKKTVLSFIEYVLHFLGGQAAVPRNASENEMLANLALKYRETCGADSRNGPTIWLGIQSILGDANWQVGQLYQSHNLTQSISVNLLFRL